MPIAAIVNGNTYAVHSDHLNTPRKLTDASGQAAWQWSYSAFGEDKPTLAKNRFANLETTPNPGTTSISEVKFNLRYPGQYADEESGLFYNGFRTYDSRTGDYTQNDKIGLAGGFNRRVYADGNPLMYSDSLGLQVDDSDRRGGPIIPIPTPADGLRELGRAIKKWYEDEDDKSYQTYTRWNPLTGQCYSGRTSGTDTPANNVKKRSAQQADLTAEGFQPGVVDKSSFNKSSVRGREQQMIEINGGAQSSGGTSRNLINGISPLNLRGPLQYIPAANAEFGTPVPSGRCTCQ
jgi:RHS repeat-associated protein